MNDLLNKLKNPVSQEDHVILQLAMIKIDQVMDEFFEVYNITEKDKQELRIRLLQIIGKLKSGDLI